MPARSGAGHGCRRCARRLRGATMPKPLRRCRTISRRGDIYQANLTFPLLADYAGDPLALYAALRPRAAAGYGGVVWTGERYYLSFSPELFFAAKDRRVTTKPMKGTAERRADPVADAAEAEHLADRSQAAGGKSDDRRPVA